MYVEEIFRRMRPALISSSFLTLCVDEQIEEAHLGMCLLE
jgi:hypothetical protein